MSSFDSELRALIDEWLKRGDNLRSMIEAMGTEIEHLRLRYIGQDAPQPRSPDYPDAAKSSPGFGSGDGNWR